MTTDKLPTLKMYYPTYDKDEGVGMYERNQPNGWHSSAEVLAREQAIRYIIMDVYNLNKVVYDGIAYQTKKKLLF